MVAGGVKFLEDLEWVGVLPLVDANSPSDEDTAGVTLFPTNADLPKPYCLVDTKDTDLIEARGGVVWPNGKLPRMGSIRRTFRHVQALYVEDFAT